MRLLHFACENGDFSIFEYFISKGANIIVRDKDLRQTPLLYANNLQFIEYLITKGANIEAHDNKGKTPLLQCN